MVYAKYLRNSTRLVFLAALVICSYNIFNFYQKRNSRLYRLELSINSSNGKDPDHGNIQLIEFGNDILQDSQEYTKDCYYPSLGRNISRHSFDADSAVKCQPIMPTEEECKAADRSYKGLPRNRDCQDDKSQITGDICWFSNSSYRLLSDANLQLRCDPSICNGKPIYIGGIHMKLGVLPDMDQWAMAKTRQELVTHLNVLIKYMISVGIDFVYLGCKLNKKTTIKQVLLLPPLLRKQTDENASDENTVTRPNINILVLDSVSREHFFRKLPLTAHALKQVNEDDSFQSSLLDFELFQSIAPRTFPNIRAFVSGEVDKDTEDTGHSYNIERLFGKLINNGYQTMLQEDSCWFDSWGALITDNIHDLTPMISQDLFMKRWSFLNKRLRSMQVNNFGLTHLSCEALLQYGVTNQFNDPPKVCYNGKFLTSYFLQYVNNHFVDVRRKEKLKPLFLYTHLNTGHEKTGQRISYIDEDLSKFVRHIAKQPDTITIILSDHGPKTTQFGRENARGRYELAHSFMFMLIPDNLKTSLADRYHALVVNQKRLVTMRDLHFTLTGLLDGKKDGLLSPIDANRGCKDLPLYSFTQCLCSGWNLRLPESDRSVVWVAEFATGYLNNLLQLMFTAGNPHRTGGYGNCERLIGKRFTNIQTRKVGIGIIYNFDIVVYRYWGEEMFEFAISEQPNYGTFEGLLAVVQWRRVSIFQHFRKCLDPNVKPDLCVCRPESSGMNPGRDLTSLLSSKFFNTKTTTSFIDSRCLALLTRTRAKSHKAYEITNICSDRTYSVSFDINRTILQVRLTPVSTTLPINITVPPWTTHFLASVSLEQIDEEILNDIGQLEVINFYTI